MEVLRSLTKSFEPDLLIKSEVIPVKLYSIHPLVPTLSDSPQAITEIARKRVYWPNGEFAGETLSRLSTTDVFGNTRPRLDLTASDEYRLAVRVYLDYVNWKSLCDSITGHLEVMNRELYLAKSMGSKVKKQRFFWLLVKALGNYEVAMMSEFHINNAIKTELSWRSLLNETGEFAGCRSALRRSDGEYVGVCRGYQCTSDGHVFIENIYRMFFSHTNLDWYSGILGKNKAVGPQQRMVLGHVELCSLEYLDTRRTTGKKPGGRRKEKKRQQGPNQVTIEDSNHSTPTEVEISTVQEAEI